MTASRSAFPDYDIPEFLKFIERFNPGELRHYVSELEARFDCARYLSPNYISALVQQMRNSIAESKPASFLRLGDGEGDILAGSDKEFPILTKISESRTSARHFGQVLRPNQLDEIRAQMQQAVRSADIVGMPTKARVNNMFRKIAERSALGNYDFRGVAGTTNVIRHAHRLLMPLQPPRMITDCYFHRDLLPHYPELLAGIDRIGLISCYPDLPQRLRRTFGIREVDYFHIPNQASNIGGRPTERHYPEAFTQVINDLAAIRPGQVVLIGAGILGKTYCHRVKGHGGIGFDIGSMADVWMGKKARRYQTEEYLKRWML